MPNHQPKTARVAMATTFGVIIFASKIILPTPIDKMFVIIQALLLALGSLLLGRMGATYVATVGGLLTMIWRAAFAPFSLIFAAVYGLMVDSSFYAFKVRMSHGDVKTSRLVASLTLSTLAIGLLTTYITVSIGLMPMIPILYLIITIVGIINGVVAGYLASLIWKRYLQKQANFAI